MNTDRIPNVLHDAIDRKGKLSLSEQLRSAVEMAVIDGEFPGNTSLPSVRRLARDLGLASNTVVRAYRDLEAEGVVRSIPRRGFFVEAAVGEATASPAHDEVLGLVDEAISAAHGMGMDRRSFLHLVADRARQEARHTRRVAVVGQRDAALADRVEATKRALADLKIDVVGLSFEELTTREGSARTAGIEWFLVPILETRQAAGLLGPHAHRIMPMNRTLKSEVRTFVAAQPDHTRFGIIAGRDEYVGRMIAALRRLRHLHVPPIAVTVSDVPGTVRLIEDADAVLIGSLATPSLDLPISKPHIEFAFIPDDATLRRLRARLLSTQSAWYRERDRGLGKRPS